MGTLLDQPPRHCIPVGHYEIFRFFGNYKDARKQYPKLTLDQFIKMMEILEYERRSTLMSHDGDIKDEQLAGFGELITRFLDMAQSYLDREEVEQ